MQGKLTIRNGGGASFCVNSLRRTSHESRMIWVYEQPGMNVLLCNPHKTQSSLCPEQFVSALFWSMGNFNQQFQTWLMVCSLTTLNLLQSSCDRQPLSSLTETSAAVPQQALGFWELLHHRLTAVSPDHYLVAAYFNSRVNVLDVLHSKAAWQCCFLSPSLSSTATQRPTVYLWSAFLPISCQLLLVFQSHRRGI